VSPIQLLGFIAILALIRIVLTLRTRLRTAAPAPAGGDATTATPAYVVLKEYLDAFIVAGLVALLLITFVVRTFFIPTGSMEPTLQIHDVLLANEFEYRFTKPHDGDIIVFLPPIPTTDDFIKRLIGSPGERLRVHSGIVYRNGVALVEPYIAAKPAYELEIKDYGIYVDGTRLEPEQSNVPPRDKWQAPDRIPEGCYFMMGDNRNDSEDSHIWGFAQTGGTFYAGPEKGKNAGFTGHAFLLFWPPGRLRILK
jgi:signal peptidase I